MHTIAQAARRLRRSERSVRRACAKHGIGSRFGKAIVLTDDDLVKLRPLIPGKVGNPQMRTKEGAAELARRRHK